MRPIRTLATALLVAGLAAAGCGTSQPDPPTTPPSQPPVVTAPPTPAPPNPTPPAPGPTGRPRVLSVTTSPALPREGGFLRLPAGAGALTFRVRAVNTQRVRFYLTPTGTGMFNENQLIGQDTNGRDGWTLVWRYPDQPLLAHLTVTAVGANGATSPWVTLGLHHPEPAPRILSVTTTPTLPREGGFLRLPAGAGTVTFRVRAVNTQRVRFFLSPTGTDTSARLLGEDTNGRDGWTLVWRYPDQPLTAHLTIKAIGFEGTSPDTVLGLYHPDPIS
ncbi:MAG TPA: hypothetical protein VFX88_12105 [Actinomycetota bacterium]|nr:hypothetical protein [Actinomycetota bacterium]